MHRAEPAVIEILEHRPPLRDGEVDLVIPNDIRINGYSVLAPADDPVVVHEITTKPDEPVRVTLTLYAKRITISSVDQENSDG